MFETNKRPSLGLGILSWRGYDSLKHSLCTYKKQNFFSLFDECRLFLPEMEQEGERIASEFGLSFSGSKDNLGILGGFESLALSMKSDFVLLLENDLPLIVNFDQARDELHRGLALLESGKVQVVRMRSREFPGQNFASGDKYLRYYSSRTPSIGERATKGMRRVMRPLKASRMIGGAPYVFAAPELRHPKEIVKDPDTGMLVISAAHIPWTNQSILIQKSFFLEKIIAYAKTASTKRRINGFRNLEIEMNSPYWRNSGWSVGLGAGILTHERKNDRGYST